MEEVYSPVSTMAKEFNMPTSSLKKIINVYKPSSKAKTLNYNYRETKDVVEKIFNNGTIVDTSDKFTQYVDTYSGLTINKYNDGYIPDSFRSSEGYVYILRLNHFFDDMDRVKVGYSIDVDSRIKVLNEAWKQFDVSFSLVKISKFLANAKTVEKSIHTVLNSLDLRSRTKVKVQGSTEIFYYKDWMLNLV